MSTNLERFFVPALHLVAISGLAFTLIVVVISRSPYTHGNLNPEGYDRTEIAVLGQNYPYHGLELADLLIGKGYEFLQFRHDLQNRVLVFLQVFLAYGRYAVSRRRNYLCIFYCL